MALFTSGDLLQTNKPYLAQGVAEGNQEGLGTGLAFKISKKWHDVQTQFKRHARSGGFRGGDIWVCKPGLNRPGFIYLATQPDMYQATVPYLRKALKRLVDRAEKQRVPGVTLPKLGAGLGKLDWIIEVKPLMIAILSDFRYCFANQYPPRSQSLTIPSSGQPRPTLLVAVPAASLATFPHPFGNVAQSRSFLPSLP